jgi:phosphoglycerate dehydrogenase-like enzyme
MAGMEEIHVVITVPFEAHLLELLKAVSPLLRIHLQPARDAAELGPELLAEAQVLYTLDTLPQPEQMPNLDWIQFHLAGIDHAIGHPLLRAAQKITTMSGVAAPQMGEFVLMCILALAHHLPLMMQDKTAKRWAEKRFKRFEPLEVAGSTVGIVGYGSIGREVARLCRAFGASVLAVKRNLKNLEDTGYMPEGMGDPQAELPDRLYPAQAIASMAALCDFLVVTVPLTAETRGMVNERVFKAMKPSAYLIDVSRGGIVDHGALVAALRDERLAGAALDVYPLEPLPTSSPLWDLPNVILSPHIAGASPRYMERAAHLFAINLERYLAGAPLLNLYDPELGY